MTIDELNLKYGRPIASSSTGSFSSRWGLQEEEKPKKTFMEKVAGFTGGEKIAQGLGQALANKEISKSIEETQKQQMEIQGNLIRAIKDKTAMGQDTTRLENALKMITEDIGNTGEGSEKLLNQKELTTKQVVGDALQLGTTVLGAGQLPGLAKTATTAITTGKGIIQGAKTGAIAGGIYGTSSGVSGALKEDKSASEIAMGGLTGGLTGAAAGAVLGGITGGISGKIQGSKLAKQQKEEKYILDLVSPKATTAIKEQAIKEGRLTAPGILKASKITPGTRDKQLAEAVKGIKLTQNPVKDADIIDKIVSELNDGLKAYVKVNKVPFNTNQLKAQLNKGKGELKLIFASDKNAKKTYDAVVSEFIKRVKNKDTAGLFQARQDFDKIPAIKKLLDSQGLGENAKREIALTARQKANEYVASLLPKGNKFRETLLKESNLIEVINNIAEKNQEIFGKNKLQLLNEKYPLLKWVVGSIVGGGIAGGVGAGATVIGSSD